MPSLSQRDVVVGMDVSKNVIVAGVLGAGVEAPVVESFTRDEASVRAVLRTFRRSRSGGGLLRGRSDGVRAAPSGDVAGCWLRGGRTLVDPEGFRDRVKTDKRDARRLAVLHEAGLLTPIRVPTRGRKRSGICAGCGRTWSAI